MSTLPPPSNPLEALINLGAGLWVSRALWAAAHLKVADAIGDAPASAAEVAAATGTDPDAMHRLLRTLVSIGVFRAEGDLFAHGELSPYLRSDHPLSQRAFVDSVFGGEHYQGWGAIADGIRTGTTAFDQLFGMNVFDWYAHNPEPAVLFSRAMESTTLLIETALLASWTPHPFTLAVDIGGSRGTLVSALVGRTPGARGILFDRPEIVESARATLVDDRIAAVGGDFFESVPEGDLYLLKLILHDWTDAQSVAILSSIRAAIRPGGHVAIIETVLPEAVEPVPGYLMDLNMMVMTGGRERTASDFAALLDQAGFALQSVTHTAVPMSVVTAVPV